MSMKSGKAFGLLLALCLILQLLPAAGLADSVIPNDLTGENDYLIIHGTSGSYPNLGGNSSLVVKNGGETLSPTGNTYSNVPAGATIEMELVFHLNSGNESTGTSYTYSGSNFFTFTLPEGITFDVPEGEDAEIYAVEAGQVEWLLGTWSFIDSNTIKVQFNSDVAKHRAIWGKIGVSGTFNAIPYGGDDKTEFVLGAETIYFTRETLPKPQIILEKDGVYDAATNTITWTVTVTPPDGTALDGYSLVDTYSPNQTYKPGSFFINDNESAVSDDDLVLTAANTIVYTFPAENITSAQTITYSTTPDTFSAETGASSAEASVFTNEAVVKSGEENLTEPEGAEVIIDWLSKRGVKILTTDGSIVMMWTVNVTVPEGGTITEAKITDTIPAGLRLLESSGDYPIRISINGGEAAAVPATEYAYTYNGVASASELVYTFTGPLTNKATLTYYTEVTSRDASLNNNDSVVFENSAALSWKEAPSGSPNDTAKATAVGSGGLLSKSGGSASDYNYPGHIHWTITVNRNDITIKNATVQDTVPVGQKLLIDDGHRFTVKHEGDQVFQAASPDATDEFTSTDGFVQKFSYALGNITDTYTIDYYTQIVDVNPGSNADTAGLDTLYANNDSVKFGNDVELTRDGTVVKTTGTKTYRSQVLEKAAVKIDGSSYDYTAHTVKWEITVNRNNLPLTNATVNDTIPEGMVLLIDSDHPFLVNKDGAEAPVATAPTTGISGDTSFEYRFGSIDAKHTISFYTVLTDETLLKQWKNSKDFTNNAALSADEIKTPIEVSAKVSISNPIVTKSYAYTAKSDYINWSVVINPAQLTLSGAEVSDGLDPGLRLDAESVKLYRVAVSPAGVADPAEDGTLLTEGYSVQLPTAENNNTLLVGLPDGKYAYRLEFTTYILADDLNFINKVALTGSTESPAGENTATQIEINDLWSSGGSGSLTLTIHKEDSRGSAVEGAEYQLLNLNKKPVTNNGVPITAVTDENGNAEFKNLPSWIFYAQEISSPKGYLLNPDIFGGDRLTESMTYETLDRPAVGTVSFSKVSTGGANLSGGEFTLKGTDQFNNPITFTQESVNGTVTFNEIPVGSYIITETKAPYGYFKTDDEIHVTVAVTQDNTDVVITVTPDALENRPIPEDAPYGSIRLKKTTSDSLPLAGAEFGLYNAGGALVKTAVSAADGLVSFDKVAFGTYTIRETKAPEGYDISKTEGSATVSVNNRNVSAEPYIFVNYKPDEILPTDGAGIRILKVDAESESPLPGAEFTLYGEDGTPLQTAVSDSEGVALFAGLEPGSYTVKETAAPNGYLADNRVISVTVDADTVYSFTVENTPDPDKTNIIDGETPSGGLLPQTGSLWDTLTLALLGAALIIGGIALIYTGKRKPHSS